MSAYLECRECGFVLLAAADADAVPKRVDFCPGCGESEFRTPDL